MAEGDKLAKVDFIAFQNRIRTFQGQIGFQLDKAFERLGQRWDSDMIDRLRKGTTTEPGERKRKGTPTGNRTRTLNRSLFSGVVNRGSRIDGKMLKFGSRMPGRFNYAITQELGATISAKKSKYLAIPLPDAYQGRAVADPPRSYPDTFVQRNPKTGNLFIIQSKNDGSFKFLFLLKRRVVIHPNLGMRSTMRAILKKNQKKEFVRALERAATIAFKTGGSA